MTHGAGDRNSSTLDGHHTFHLGKSCIIGGAHARGIALIDRAITMGFYPVEYLERICPFFDDVRGTRRLRAREPGRRSLRRRWAE